MAAAKNTLNPTRFMTRFVCGADLKVVRLVVQRGPGAEAGLGPQVVHSGCGVMVGPAELPALH